LINNLKTLNDFDHRIEDATQLLSILTGIYEESARSCASMNSATDD
jgi:predicted MarR family transcription regulator